MNGIIERGATSQIEHVFIPDSASATGAGKTGLTFNTSGLKIVVMRPGEAAPTKYLQSAGNIEDITTLGTYQAPTAGKCRFKEIDATDMPGWYELQFADALYNTTSSRRALEGVINGASGIVPTPFSIQLADPTRGVASPTALPNAAANAAGGLPISAAGGLDLDARLDAAVSSRSSHSAADIWAVGSRTLTSFGSLVSDVATAVWGAATRTLSAFGFTPSLHTDYDAAKTAAQASALATTDGKVDAIKAKTDNLPPDPADQSLIIAAADALAALINGLNDLSAADVLTQVNAALDAAVPDSIPADGDRPSIRQAAYMNTQFLVERDVSGTTLTVMKPDGVTPLFTCTLNHPTAPTSITRAS